MKLDVLYLDCAFCQGKFDFFGNIEISSRLIRENLVMRAFLLEFFGFN